LVLMVPVVACVSPPRDVVRTEIPGTRVAIAGPTGFVISKRFPGLVNADALASVMISEIPRAPDQVRNAMTSEELAARGSELLGSEEVSVDGRQAWLYHVAAGSTTDREILRWVLVTGENDSSVVIAATAPRFEASRLGPALRDALLSATWDAGRVLGPWDGLGFQVDEGETLKLSDRLPRMVALTKGGHGGAIAPDEPLFLAGSSAAMSAITDLAGYAHQQLRITAELVDITALSETPLTLDGLPAYEIVASATDNRSQTPLRIYQMLVVDGADYFLLQGMVGASNAEVFVAEFGAIARSFRRTR
jgi:hypothetical protein